MPTTRNTCPTMTAPISVPRIRRVPKLCGSALRIVTCRAKQATAAQKMAMPRQNSPYCLTGLKLRPVARVRSAYAATLGAASRTQPALTGGSTPSRPVRSVVPPSSSPGRRVDPWRGHPAPDRSLLADLESQVNMPKRITGISPLLRVLRARPAPVVAHRTSLASHLTWALCRSGPGTSARPAHAGGESTN